MFRLIRNWFSHPQAWIWLGVLIVLGSLVLGIVRVAGSARSLQGHLNAVESMAKDNANLDLSRVHSELAGTKADFDEIRSDTGWALPAMPLLGWLPQIGGDLSELPNVMNMAGAVLAASDAALDGWSPLIDLINQRGNSAARNAAPLNERLIAPLTENRSRFTQAKSYLDSAAVYRARINREHLSPRLASLVARVDRLLPLMNLAADGGLVLPELLGASGPRTYLLIAQNEDELRATGGFISAAGRITLNHGKIVELDFMDSYQVDDLNKDYPLPPQPLQTYMLASMWLFRDANWSPDFPTSARQLIDFYKMGQGRAVDGAIAIDQETVHALITAIGPIEIGGSAAQIVTGDNLITFMRSAWAPTGTLSPEAWYAQRKSFIGNLAKALQTELTSGHQLNWVGLAKTTYGLLQGRHLQIYVNDASLAASLARLGWDGALRNSDGDYLAVIDSNVGFTKVNPLIAQSFQYEVSIGSDMQAHADLSVAYKHTGQAGPACKEKIADYTLQITYEELMNTCYWDYLRLYVPKGSALQDATRYPIPAVNLLSGKPSNGDPQVLAGEAGKGVFASFFVVERGGQRVVRFRYDPPNGVVRSMGNGLWKYSLYWQKQAGTPAFPSEARIVLPAGASLVSADSSANAVLASEMTEAGLRLSYQFDLASDFTAEVVFRR
jgi:uncharacterized protein DUF4012